MYADQMLRLLGDLELKEEDYMNLCVWRDSGYGRTSLYYCESFELVLISWQPHADSGVHNHNKSEGVLKVLKGSLVETRNGNPELGTNENTQVLGEGDVYAFPLGFHRMINDTNNRAVSIHLYAPSFNYYDSVKEDGLITSMVER